MALKTPARTSIPILELTGDPLEIAYQLGKRRKKPIARAVEFWNTELAHLYRSQKSQLKFLEKGFLQAAKKYLPDYLEEIRAMAEGAGVTFPDLFRLNLTELHRFAEKCTDIIFPLETAQGRRILIAHNEDWEPRRNDLFLLKVKLPQAQYLTLAYNGYLPGLSAGLNGFGLVHSVNYLAPKDLRIGVPRIFLTRYLLTAPHIKEVFRFLNGLPRAFGQGIHLAQGSRYVGLELTARYSRILKPRLPSAHTNHYVSKILKPYAAQASAGSVCRLRVARRLLRKSGATLQRAKFARSVVRKQARHILSDRSGLPYPLWRNAGGPKDTSATLATVLLDSGALQMEIFRGPPTGSSQGRFRINV